MADYFTHLSFMVTGSVEEQNLLVEMIKAADELAEEQDEVLLGVTADIDKDGVWIRDDYGHVEIELLCDTLSAWLEAIGSNKGIGIEWANTCNKPRLDAFGGGAAAVKAAGVEYYFTSKWLTEALL